MIFFIFSILIFKFARSEKLEIEKKKKIPNYEVKWE